MVQSREEHAMHLRSPDAFPPNPIYHAVDKMRKAREKRRAKQDVQKEVQFMRSNRSEIGTG